MGYSTPPRAASPGPAPVQGLPALSAIPAVLDNGHPGAKQRLHNGPLLVDRPHRAALLLQKRHAVMFWKHVDLELTLERFTLKRCQSSYGGATAYRYIKAVRLFQNHDKLIVNMSYR